MMPFVSVIIIITEKDYIAVSNLINDFKHQNYCHKELIIINNAKNHFTATEFNITSVPDVYLIDTPFKLVTGIAYNYGLSVSRGQIITPMYINYKYGPDYINEVVELLYDREESLCYLEEIGCYNLTTNMSYIVSSPKRIIPESIAYTRPINIDYSNVDFGFELGLISKFKNVISRNSLEISKVIR